MKYLADRVRQIGPSVFYEMTNLANQHGAINLGQGFPDFPGPEFVKEAAIQAIRDDINQYAPSRGHAGLREQIAAKMGHDYGWEVDPATEIVVTAGATEAIFATILGLVNPGDEVILFEPYYDSYRPAVEFAGGIARYYTLEPPDWKIDMEQLATLFTEHTKLIVINTPHNPTGKVFTRATLGQIGALCQEYDVVAVTDEVYEHIIYDGMEHVPMATLPGMRDRTVTISSTGKTFSVTGWKAGWTVAPPELTEAVFRTHQFITFCGASPLQVGLIKGLEAPPDYYRELAALYQSNRDFLNEALSEAGLKPISPQGTYFVMVDIEGLGFEDDRAFCRFLTTEIGVAAIPPGSFYSDPLRGADLARFAFCKTRETLEKAADRLMRLKEKI